MLKWRLFLQERCTEKENGFTRKVDIRVVSQERCTEEENGLTRKVCCWLQAGPYI